MADEERPHRSGWEITWDFIFFEPMLALVLLGGVYLVSFLLGEAWNFLHYLAYAAVVLVWGVGVIVTAVGISRNPRSLRNRRNSRREPASDSVGEVAAEKARPTSGQDLVWDFTIQSTLPLIAMVVGYFLFEQLRLLACFLIFVGLTSLGVGLVMLYRTSRP